MPTLTAVSLRPDPSHAGFVTVFPVWDGVDRPTPSGWSAPHHLVDRLVRAILNGAAVRNPVIKTDVHGKTYVETDFVISGREMEQDLEAIGF
jgi:hypothetical protein